VETEWQVSRLEARGRGGMVAAKTPQAAAAGVEVLRQGGNAVDAAVTTAFTAGVVEPWMNGIGGGGYMVVHVPDEDPAVVAYPMIAPVGARPEMFPLSGAGSDAALFGWPEVVGSANVWGYRSVAVPGTVAGLALALERWGTISLAEALAPAIRWAEEGVPVFWHTTLMIAGDLATLQQFPTTAAIFLDLDGNPPVTDDQTRPFLLRQEDLARTLRTIASDGPRVMYEGAIGQAIAADLAANGAPFTGDDLASYQASIAPALSTTYGGSEVHTLGGGTGGTTLVESLNILSEFDQRNLGYHTPLALHRMIQAFRTAFADRFAWLADATRIEIPVDLLTSQEYARERSECLATERLEPIPAAAAERTGIRHGLESSIPDYVSSAAPGQMADGSTTHLSVMDRDGMAVSCTQTLLSLWGSRVTTPGTGVLLNNGMMWFDPEPGRPNSVAGGKTPLSNMAPVILSRDGRPWASLGASGGRRIMNANAQLVMNFTDWRLAAQPSITAPRIDCSTAETLLSWRFPTETVKALRAMGHRVGIRDERHFTGGFASPAAIRCTLDGVFDGGADPFYAPATAQAAHGVLER
ncbi:MAG TPA: gamma-glutamyltransferase family protein, partial [Thermomicrobiales bacterium]|nr:gamma-glutamyltransferase family protein [Thermomicrobiales bacterium]